MKRQRRPMSAGSSSFAAADREGKINDSLQVIFYLARTYGAAHPRENQTEGLMQPERKGRRYVQ